MNNKLGINLPKDVLCFGLQKDRTSETETFNDSESALKWVNVANSNNIRNFFSLPLNSSSRVTFVGENA